MDEVVRLHQALADRSRLKIAQALFTADVSPGELAALLGISSNLLAHHLNVLEAAGVMPSGSNRGRPAPPLRRPRPQRGWVARQVAAGLHTHRLGPVSRLAFVCTRDSARSPLAAAVGTATTPRCRRSGRNRSGGRGASPCGRPGARGEPLNSTGTSAIEDTVTTRKQFVIAVWDQVVKTTPSNCGECTGGIPAPVALDTESAFTDTYRQLSDRIDRLGPTLEPEGPD